MRLAASLRARHPYGPRLLSARPLGGRSRHAHRQTHPRRRLGAVAIAAFLALGLAACAGDTDPATNITATTATPLENGKAYYFRACGQDVNDSSAVCAGILSLRRMPPVIA